MKTALVVGAQGVIGRNLVEYLLTQDDWNIIGLSRRSGQFTNNLQHIAVDLLDKQDPYLLYGLPGPPYLGRAGSPQPGQAGKRGGSRGSSGHRPATREPDAGLQSIWRPPGPV